MAQDQSMPMKLTTLAISFGAGLLAQKAVKLIWVKVTGQEPSMIDDDDATLLSVVTFAGVTGATAALTRYLAGRGTAKLATRAGMRR